MAVSRRSSKGSGNVRESRRCGYRFSLSGGSGSRPRRWVSGGGLVLAEGWSVVWLATA